MADNVPSIFIEELTKKDARQNAIRNKIGIFRIGQSKVSLIMN